MKKKYLLLFLIMTFFTCVSKVKARNVDIVIGEEIPNVTLHIKTPTTEENKNLKKIVRVEDGELLYGIEPGVVVYDGYFREYNSFLNNPLSISKEEWLRVSEIVYFGYGYQDRTDIKWYITTQFMIWDYLLRDTGEVYFIDSNNEKLELYEEEMAIINKDILEYRATSSFMKQSTSGIDYTVRVNEELVLEDSKGVIDKFLVEDIIGNQLTWRIENNKLYLKFATAGYKYVLYRQSNTMNVPPRIYYSGIGQSFTSRGQISLPTGVTEIEVLNPSLTIKSLNETSSSLKGAVYGLYNTQGILIEELTTNEEGIIYKDTINVGTYYIKELVAPLGYELNEEVIYFEVTDKNILLEVKNNPINKNIVLEKYLEYHQGNMELEKEAVFEIYNKKSRELVKTITTNEYGKVEFQLPYGEYTLKQIKTKTGFKLADEIIINVQDSELEILVLTNEEIVQDLTIINKDKDTGEVILGEASFKIKNKDTLEYLEIANETIFKTVDGMLTLKNIPYGTYILEEVETPLGYKTSENLEFQINEKAVELEVFNELKKGSILIYKLDKENLKPLSDVLFGLYDENKNLIRENKTNSAGEILFDNLDIGTYYIKELLASERDSVNEEEIKVEVKEDIKSIITVTDRLKVEVPKTGVKKSITSFLLSSLLLGIGTIICNYDKKDN